jgi:hypothetical protein
MSYAYFHYDKVLRFNRLYVCELKIYIYGILLLIEFYTLSCNDTLFIAARLNYTKYKFVWCHVLFYVPQKNWYRQKLIMCISKIFYHAVSGGPILMVVSVAPISDFCSLPCSWYWWYEISWGNRQFNDACSIFLENSTVVAITYQWWDSARARTHTYTQNAVNSQDAVIQVDLLVCGFHDRRAGSPFIMRMFSRRADFSVKIFAYMSILLLSVVTPWGFVRYRRFGGSYGLHLQWRWRLHSHENLIFFCSFSSVPRRPATLILFVL